MKDLVDQYFGAPKYGPFVEYFDELDDSTKIPFFPEGYEIDRIAIYRWKK